MQLKKLLKEQLRAMNIQPQCIDAAGVLHFRTLS